MSTIQYISWNKKTHGKQADDANSTQTNCILVLKTPTQANFQYNCRPERENFRVVVPEKNERKSEKNGKFDGYKEENEFS